MRHVCIPHFSVFDLADFQRLKGGRRTPEAGGAGSGRRPEGGAAVEGDDALRVIEADFSKSSKTIETSPIPIIDDVESRGDVEKCKFDQKSFLSLLHQ